MRGAVREIDWIRLEVVKCELYSPVSKEGMEPVPIRNREAEG